MDHPSGMSLHTNLANTVFIRISAALGTKKANKRRPRRSAAVLIRRLLEEFFIIYNDYQESLQRHWKCLLQKSDVEGGINI